MSEIHPRRLKPLHFALIVAVLLAVIAIVVAFVFNTFWLWIIALIPTVAAIQIARVMAGVA